MARVKDQVYTASARHLMTCIPELITGAASALCDLKRNAKRALQGVAEALDLLMLVLIHAVSCHGFLSRQHPLCVCQQRSWQAESYRMQQHQYGGCIRLNLSCNGQS
mmetsp:Transcript_18869/g.40635  ORF Transcript_18869/g.40635 Transcript_18869/m.40635 type:complete len:107 (+) Transcript_18869:3863-4183(+)